MTIVHYKYNIGDRVLLTEVPSKYCNYESLGEKFAPTEYEISGLGWTIDKDGVHAYYRLHAYLDKWLQYHNCIDESMLEPVGDNHPHDMDIDTRDMNGDEICIGDNILANIAMMRDDNIRTNTNFVFAGEGIVEKMGRFKDGTKHIDNTYTIIDNGVGVSYRRRFVCTFKDGSDMLDSRRYNNLSTENLSSCCKRLPANFVDMYVKQCIKERMNPLVTDKYSYHDVWLEHFGIYEDVKVLYKKLKEKSSSKTRTKKSITQSDKLSNIVNSLSDKEKAELIRMLSKNSV